MIRVLLVALVCLSGISAPAAPSATTPADTLIVFTMTDQFDQERTDAEIRGHVALLLWVDRKGSDHVRRWERMLARELRSELAAGEVVMRRVGGVRGVPGFIKGRVKKSFPREAEAWAYLDWEGLFEAAYGPWADHLNLLVFDAGGRLVHRAAVTGLEQGALDEAAAAVRAAITD